MEEMARAAVTAGRHGVGHDAEAGMTPDAVPSTVQAVLAARIDGLQQLDKHVLQTASAFGTRFSLAGLRALFGAVPGERFEAQLDRLREAGLLRPDRHADADEGFAHGLIQEVAYEGMPRDRRRALHSEIVGALKGLYSDRLAEQSETLAYHALRGEVWEEVAVHARRAGHRAVSRSAYRDAAVFFDQAIDAQDYLAPSEEGMGHQIDLRFELRAALFPTAGISRVLTCSERRCGWRSSWGDPRRIGWATAFHARDLTLFGRPGEALVLAARALETAGEDEELIVVGRSYLALAAYSRGTTGSARRCWASWCGGSRRGTRWVGIVCPGRRRCSSGGGRAGRWRGLGESQEAEQVTDAMMDRAERSGQPLCMTVAHLSQGFVWAFAGRLREARETLAAALGLCERWAFFSWFTNIASCLGHVSSRLGDVEGGIGLLQRAAERNRASGILISQAHVTAWLAEAHLDVGRWRRGG